jgi:DNA adenine methylase
MHLVRDLLPLIPPHTCYVEAFAGSAALLLNKPPSKIEVLNDADGELVNLFEVIRDDVDVFLERADFLLYSRELYKRWQADVQNGTVPDDRVERAVRFWYVCRSAFAGAHSWAFTRTEVRSNARVIQSALAHLRAIHDRLKTVEIDHLDFRRCIRNRDAASTFMFLDPPYPETSQYRVGNFTLDDHRELAELLHHVQGKWLVTIGEHKIIRDIYADFYMRSVTSPMAVKKVIGGKRGRLRHLLIRNYDPPKIPLYTATAGRLMALNLFGI